MNWIQFCSYGIVCVLYHTGIMLKTKKRRSTSTAGKICLTTSFKLFCCSSLWYRIRYSSHSRLHFYYRILRFDPLAPSCRWLSNEILHSTTLFKVRHRRQPESLINIAWHILLREFNGFKSILNRRSSSRLRTNFCKAVFCLLSGRTRCQRKNTFLPWISMTFHLVCKSSTPCFHSSTTVYYERRRTSVLYDVRTTKR